MEKKKRFNSNGKLIAEVVGHLPKGILRVLVLSRKEQRILKFFKREILGTYETRTGSHTLRKY